MLAMTKPRPKKRLWVPAPTDFDCAALNRFLEQQGIEPQQRDLLIQDVVNAACAFGQHPERSQLRADLEKTLAAAEQLQNSLPPLGSERFLYLHGAIAWPRQSFNERSQALCRLGLELKKVIDGASDALKALGNGSPTVAESVFFGALAKAWKERTGRDPTLSGEMTFDAPLTAFGNFAKICSEITAAAQEKQEAQPMWRLKHLKLREQSAQTREAFRKGFSTRVRRAVERCQNPLKKS
jgi:hypothetical protein